MIDSLMKQLRRELLMEMSIRPLYAKAFRRDHIFEFSNKGSLKEEMLALKKKMTCAT